ncbi:MAG: EscU/YscU/HrcU family type III secretion system export apparatus switch protein [Sphingobacteriia bacterium]|nr:EscU/YscU/HrcU family type III secretion system export apparatus switch protein [Sphingobacteriia bacterium]
MANKKDKIAIALEYDKLSDVAPKVTAKGKGVLADKIIELAQKYNIEVHQDKELAEILGVLELDSIIPMEAYMAVAEILSYIYDKKKKDESNNEG